MRFGISDRSALISKHRDRAEVMSIGKRWRLEYERPAITAGCRCRFFDAKCSGPRGRWAGERDRVAPRLGRELDARASFVDWREVVETREVHGEQRLLCADEHRIFHEQLGLVGPVRHVERRQLVRRF